MNRIAISLASAVLAALAIATTTSNHIVQPVYAKSGCSDATLKGNYGFVFSGFTVPGQNAKAKEIPFAGTGAGTFDGTGNFSATANISQNGVIYPNFPYTAAYVVTSDCTGSMISTDGNANLSLVVVSGGAEVLALDVDAGNTWTMDLKKQ